MPDLHACRRAIAALCATAADSGDPSGLPPRLVIVPTRGAATALGRTLTGYGFADDAVPAMVTRDQLYDALHARLVEQPRRLSPFERDAMAQAAAIEAASQFDDLPFRVRPGLVAELLRFYESAPTAIAAGEAVRGADHRRPRRRRARRPRRQPPPAADTFPRANLQRIRVARGCERRARRASPARAADR
ncbi:MAG: hypothetical protein QM736_13705 [Vicinamibacterales bacterium]